MKVLDVEPLVILDVYTKEIRSAWNRGLTQKQVADIERVQRVAVSVILSDCKTGYCEFSYNMALVILDLEPLDVRRENLCKTFAKKTLKIVILIYSKSTLTSTTLETSKNSLRTSATPEGILTPH